MAGEGRLAKGEPATRNVIIIIITSSLFNNFKREVQCNLYLHTYELQFNDRKKEPSSKRKLS